MNDEYIAALLDSNEPLVVVEAPAGCGKTYQGAEYARRAASGLENGRILILTHTHAACGAFATATRQVHHKVEIRTIDSLIVQIASAYHKSLSLPTDVSAWARRNPEGGFDKLADGVASLISCHPMVCAALAERYPIVICDEHQDANTSQHALIMSINAAGARTRIFGDPLQSLYPERNKFAAKIEQSRWGLLKKAGRYEKLTHPYRWDDGSRELGRWIMNARTALAAGQPIEIGGELPAGLSILNVVNRAPTRSGFQLNPEDRKSLDRIVRAAPDLLILSSENETVSALRAFWHRQFPIWEGHIREHIGQLVSQIAANPGDARLVAQATVDFVASVAVGFTASSHGNRLVREVSEGCAKHCRGKPAHLQQLGCHILERPDHTGVAKCLAHLAKLIDDRVAGFGAIKIDRRREFRDALRLIEFADPEEGLTEIARRRSFARPMPPNKAISTIHKAKGLQCDCAVVLPCDGQHFSTTEYSRRKLYVALSRAKHSLTLVTSRDNPSPLFHVHKIQ